MLQRLMNKTIISLLIWLVCMPCMAAAETSKELDMAQATRLFQTMAKQEVEAFRGDAEPNDDLTMMCIYVS